MSLNRHAKTLLQTGFTTVHVRFNQAGDCAGVPSVNPVAQVGTPPWNDPVQSWEQRAKRQQMPQSAPPMPGDYELSRLYTYKALLKDGVKAGDVVIVEVARGLIPVTVEKVDDSPKVDMNAQFDYKWIVQKVDMTQYNQLNAKEKEFDETLTNIERCKVREQVKADLFQFVGAEGDAKLLLESAVKAMDFSAGVTTTVESE